MGKNGLSELPPLLQKTLQGHTDGCKVGGQVRWSLGRGTPLQPAWGLESVVSFRRTGGAHPLGSLRDAIMS